MTCLLGTAIIFIFAKVPLTGGHFFIPLRTYGTCGSPNILRRFPTSPFGMHKMPSV
ncbi:MAG TPA: hypothetical protein IAB72_01290 [Candidatus Onthoplasma faecipullorum]|nr:hypothetical protein [Candidatus Onthoplasma faecipullorum]